ncbi:MAG: serine/threonine phosphatase [Fischerella sp.]|jgi:protein phosphatase|uniref:serine/threonine phosphatase n=1 Tax=Fischerella sp. TaxID=1191 RepID=UPI00184DC1A9|nr:serine/threonine phosphatase [Fischerella sp.]NWF58926.1 serine/threonine phosphatase [Fischerella sp.]
MLICPQCKFENPNSNKFCQNCGASLTHKVCFECNAEVPVNAQKCHNCGAECGRVWLAIITKEENSQPGEAAKIPSVEREVRRLGDEEKDDGEIGKWGDREMGRSGDGEKDFTPSPQHPTTLSQKPHNPNPTGSPPEGVYTPSLLPEGTYLDQQQRYQLLEPLPNLEEIPTNTWVCVQVLDCQPYQISLLEAMVTNQSQGLVAPSLMDTDGFPSLAKAYLILQPQVHQGIPPIHDAWQQDDIQVVLIEDRSDWPYLLDLWCEETTSSLQMVNCFYQMTRLWALLEPLNCCHSLLELSNLRLDEDQAVALQMLYVEPLNSNSADQASATSEEPPTIAALGRVWQKLFRESQRTQFGSLLQLLGDLEIGKIETLLELQTRLQAIATELQPTEPQPNSSVSELNFTPVENQTTNSPTILQLDKPEEDYSTKSDDLPTVVLPMQLISLEHAGLTDVGRQRHHNEDYFGIDTKINKLELPNSRSVQARALYILCDGMGGHAGGEVASALAVNTVRQYFQTHWIDNELPTEDQIREAVGQANQSIYSVNQQDARSGVGRMGTTLVMLLIQDTQAAVAHVGDSRLYRLTRKGGLEQITVDHEVGQREISRGVEASVAYARPDAYQLTQALGPRDESLIVPDVEFFEIAEDTLFVLASDGLSDNDLLETHWQTHLLPLIGSDANLESGVKNLIDMANDYNGHDNITVVLVRAKVRPNLESQKGIVNG